MSEDPLAELDEVDDGFAGLADGLRSILEVVLGHRAQLLAEGFSESAAEVMAVDLHRDASKWFFGMLTNSLRKSELDDAEA